VIRGVVERGFAAIIPIIVRGPHGEPQQLSGLIDTGFDGFLTLPPEIIAALQLPWLRVERVLLGNGSETTDGVYEVVIEWDGLEFAVEAGEADTEPLVGMSMMAGYTIRIDNVEGGAVELTRL
jgi:clan AA aspartic protease